MRDLHAIQRDLLIILGEGERLCTDSLKHAMDEYHSVSLPNKKFRYHIDQLIEIGYVKSELDESGGRTASTIVITEKGSRVVRKHNEWRKTLRDNQNR